MMNGKQINAISDVDIANLTFSDLRIHTGTFQSISHGSGFGKKYTARVGYLTAIGDIREDVWQQLAENLVERAGEEDILKRLLENVETMAYMRHEPYAKRRRHALELHMMRIFDNPGWVDFIPFNEAWRPEVVANADIIWVYTECCQKSGRVTRQQIYGYTSSIDRVFCPHCGRPTEFRQLEGPKSFKITFGSGLAWAYIRFVDTEAFECEQDAVDKMIDQLEKDKDTHCFLTQEQIDSGDYHEDEYIVGGSHGLYLHHHGLFFIEEIERRIVYDEKK